MRRTVPDAHSIQSALNCKQVFATPSNKWKVGFVRANEAQVTASLAWHPDNPSMPASPADGFPDQPTRTLKP